MSNQKISPDKLLPTFTPLILSVKANKFMAVLSIGKFSFNLNELILLKLMAELTLIFSKTGVTFIQYIHLTK